MDPACRLVQDLAEQLAKGGEEQAKAAMAFALLLERERIAVADEEAIRRALGPAVADQRLTPLAFHQAVDVLLAHIRRTAVPESGVVWALGKSFDPRIVPHVVALLERIIDHPRHDAVAHQAVVVLTFFFDARATAGLRLAAARGRGEARDHAVRWLDGREETASPARRHVPSASKLVGCDIYRLQRRPGTRQVVVNDAQRRLVVFDPFTGDEVLRAPFSGGFDARQTIRTWCLSADGKQAAVFPDGGAGSLLHFADGLWVDLEAPPRGPLENLRYVWDDRLVVAIGEATTFWALARREGGAAFEKLPWLDVRREHPGFAACIDALVPLSSLVLRTEPDAGRILAYDYATPPGDLVALSWRAEPELRVKAPQFVPELAYHDGRLLLLYDHEVQAVDASGNVTDVFPAPDRTYLRAMDTVPGALVVAAAPLDAPDTSILLTYPL